MSKTLTEIRTAFLVARKERNADVSSFLSTIIGEIEAGAKMIDGEKVVVEESVIAILKSFEKKNTEFANVMIEKALAVPEKVLHERDLILSFLPKQLEDGEIHMILLRSGAEKNMGALMKYLKENYAGRYDGKQASRLVKEILDGPVFQQF